MSLLRRTDWPTTAREGPTRNDMTPNDELPPDRANRIADAVESIERDVVRLRELQAVTRQEYGADDAQDLRDAVERKFEKLAEATLDVATQIAKQEGRRVPE